MFQKKEQEKRWKKQKAKREAREAREAENANLELESKAEEHVEEAGSKEQICNDENIKESSDLNEVFEDADDDGDWITPRT